MGQKPKRDDSFAFRKPTRPKAMTASHFAPSPIAKSDDSFWGDGKRGPRLGESAIVVQAGSEKTEWSGPQARRPDAARGPPPWPFLPRPRSNLGIIRVPFLVLRGLSGAHPKNGNNGLLRVLVALDWNH